ncbi:uncharacterized protein LOC129604998 [Betta splendens]|uniref:Uncharacterized protein LOC129604998 n=1 Tax=Betta splendens TaxID=158456 RepID=A0A9W2Y7J6_BETSP|nr:uncharacterized protein LOC129604998 [Betta splendens]
MSSFNSSNSSPDPIFTCTNFKTTMFVFSSFVFSYVLFLPLFFFIIFLAVRQWREQRRRSTAARTSHSDFFTYNVVVLELINIWGYCLCIIGIYSRGQTLQLTGTCICSITAPAQNLLHLLTCVERYLAVIQPITYLSLKQASGLRLRNASAACVWLLCAGLMGPNLFNKEFLGFATLCILLFSLTLVSFCSFSVLCVLHQSGPGRVSRDRKQVDQTRQRAFNTIAAIMLAQCCKFVGNLVSAGVFSSPVSTITDCVVGISALWLGFPCSLVLPLLYLQRAGRLPGCKTARSQDEVQIGKIQSSFTDEK